MHTVVWVGEEGYVYFFAEDDNGNPIGMANPSSIDLTIDTPLFSPCFHADTEVSAALEQTRKLVTGRAVPKITRRAYTYEGAINYLYVEKTSDLRLDDLFSRGTFFTMVFLLTDFALKSAHYIRRGNVNNWSIKSQDGSGVAISLSFAAEIFE